MKDIPKKSSEINLSLNEDNKGKNNTYFFINNYKEFIKEEENNKITNDQKDNQIQSKLKISRNTKIEI